MHPPPKAPSKYWCEGYMSLTYPRPCPYTSQVYRAEWAAGRLCAEVAFAVASLWEAFVQMLHLLWSAFCQLAQQVLQVAQQPAQLGA